MLKNTREIDAKWHVKAKEKVSVTSACDLGEACHLGLFLVHAIIANWWHSQEVHACTKFHRCFPSFSTVEQR